MTDGQKVQNEGDAGKEGELKGKTDILLEAAPKVTPAPPPSVAPPLSAPPSIPQKERKVGDSKRNLFWSFMGEDRPPKDPKKRNSFTKGFQKLFVAGTMGAFFTALLRNLPLHLKQFAWPPDPNYTIDLFVRYLYLLWLLAYFLVSNIGIDDEGYRPSKWDVIYDVGQSALSLTAAFFLGFILPDQGYRLGAYAITNVVICAICFVALAWFHDAPGATRAINRLRIVGGVISASSFLLALYVRAYIGPQTWVFIVFGVIVLILIVSVWSSHLDSR